MIICYGLAGENAAAAARIYAERHPAREQLPAIETIRRCIRRARETGYLLPDRHNAGAPERLLVHNEERMLHFVRQNPRTSVRRAANALGLSRYAVHRTFQQKGLHSYHFQRVQQLSAADYLQRLRFYEGIYNVFLRSSQ